MKNPKNWEVIIITCVVINLEISKFNDNELIARRCLRHITLIFRARSGYFQSN